MKKIFIFLAFLMSSIVSIGVNGMFTCPHEFSTTVYADNPDFVNRALQENMMRARAFGFKFQVTRNPDGSFTIVCRSDFFDDIWGCCGDEPAVQ